MSDLHSKFTLTTIISITITARCLLRYQHYRAASNCITQLLYYLAMIQFRREKKNNTHKKSPVTTQQTRQTSPNKAFNRKQTYSIPYLVIITLDRRCCEYMKNIVEASL